MMRRVLNVKVCTLTLAAVALVAPRGVQAQAPQQQATQTPAEPQGPGVPQIDRYVVGQAKPPVTPGSPSMDLTLERAYEIALERNLSLQSARMNPILQDYSIRSLNVTYLPRFTGSYSYNNSSTINENVQESVDRIVQQRQSYSGAVSQTLRFYGASVSASFNSGRSTSNATLARINPSYSSGFSMSYNMPLLSGFKIDNNRNQARTLPIQKEITDIELQNSIESVKTSIRNAYWSLRSAIENIEIQKLALAMAERTLSDNRIRVEIGTMAPIELANPELTVATSQQSLLNAEISWRNAEIALKRLLVAGLDDQMTQSTINPVDVPRAVPPPTIDIPAVVNTALQQRTDVIISRKNLQVAELNLEVTKNSLMPQLNMSAGYSASGTGGNIFQQGVLVDPGGYGEALRTLFGLDNPTWNIGLNFTYPLGMRSAKINYATAQIRLDQQRLTAKNQELTVQSDITRLALNVDNTFRQYEVAQRSRQVAERNLEAELIRFDNGMSNNFTVAQAQERVTQQRQTELSRLIAYVNALADFERAQKFPG